MTTIKSALPAALLGLLLCLPLTAGAAEVREIVNFQKEGAAAARCGLPILIMFSSAECPYCVRVEEDFLEPMLISGDYEERVIIRKVRLDRPTRAITDFDGSAATVGDLTERYDIMVMPTLIYVDGSGKELAQRQVGMTTPDYFGGYIDQRIADAHERFDEQRRLAGMGDRVRACRTATGGAPAAGAGG